MTKLTLAEAVALVKQYGSINSAWPHAGVKRTTLQNRFKQAVDAGLAHWTDAGHSGMPTNEDIKQRPVAGRLKVRATPAAHDDGKKTFILTCAQNNTHMHSVLWVNLLALAAHDKARLIVARTVYNRFSQSADMDKKLVIDNLGTRQSREYWWDDAIKTYLLDDRVEIAPGIVWCGETNVIPTAASPLTGYEGYTGRKSTIIPHPRIAMRSVASHAKEDTKLMFTTGTVTVRNYIQRKAGQLAEFHHCYGALLVEVDAGGTWFARQLNADSDGTIYDLDRKVENGRVTTGHRLKAINWGDLHRAYSDPVFDDLAWSEGGILDILRPEYQFMHDLIDNRVVNPHRVYGDKNLDSFVEYQKGHTSVEKEMIDAALFLSGATRPWCDTVVVNSNHDNWLVSWLERYGNFRKDPENAIYFLEAAHFLWSETQAHEGEYKPNMTEWAMRRELDEFEHVAAGVVQFLDEDDSFVICPDANGGIQCGMHGHQGANGSGGTPTGLSKMGRKANIGDKHSAGIYDGLYVSGIAGSLDQGYNSGPGSWSQTNIFTYQNGKRALSTIFDGKWRA